MRGGVTAVAAATGLTRKTIHFGIRELEAEAAGLDSALPPNRVRRAGAGRKPITERQPKLVGALEALVEPSTRGVASRRRFVFTTSWTRIGARRFPTACMA